MTFREEQDATRSAGTVLRTLHSVTRTLEDHTDLEAAIERVLQIVGRELGLTHCTVSLLNRETGELAVDLAPGMSTDQRAKGRFTAGEGIIGGVVESAEPAIVPRIGDDAAFLHQAQAWARPDLRNRGFLCVPIKLGVDVVGTLSAICHPASPTKLEEDAQLLAIVAALLAHAVAARRSAREERHRIQSQRRPSNIIGNSKAMRHVFEMISQVSPSDATVLIRGESGVGKELVAEAIHQASSRAQRPLIRVNCAALPPGVLESELFGHEQGAFTGAMTKRKGRFELADGGTIFLDEIGDFSAATQIALLRILQQKEFERVGGSETIKTDVRIIAATNRDLAQLMAEGKFRQDLYYRLDVFPMHVPPLRERPTDIPLLADHFVEKYAKESTKVVRRITTPAIDMLMSYHWPGNVRELENCIARAVLLSDDGVIHAHHLPPTLQTAEASGTTPRGTLNATLDALERDMLEDALKTAHGNMAAAARALGISERVMGLRVKKHGIDLRRFRARR